MKWKPCEYEKCPNFFDSSDHRFQRFCSKRCAKLGTKLRHKGLINAYGEWTLEFALFLVAYGYSYSIASKVTGIKKATIHVHYTRLMGKSVNSASNSLRPESPEEDA